MPFGDGMFDRVIAAEVLEHILDDQRAMNELARVLRPGGLAAITVPSFLPERICWALSDEYHEVPGGHVRIYTRVELEAKLARAGLTPMWHHHAHGLHSPYWWLKCAVGVHDDKHRLASAYHKLLVWDIMRRPGERPGRVFGSGLALDWSAVVATGEYIARMQEPDGGIPWPDGHVEAWD